VLQRVAVCCSVLQCVAVCCSVVQRGAVCCSVFAVCCSMLQCVAVCCSVLQTVSVVSMSRIRSRWLQLTSYVAATDSIYGCNSLPRPCLVHTDGDECASGPFCLDVHVCCSVLQCVAVCCSVLQCVAVRCIVLQSISIHSAHPSWCDGVKGS